jgi:hypothetical protein
VILTDVFTTVIQKEMELDEKGYYTFVHGQRSTYLFPEKLFTTLSLLENQKDNPDFMFLHIKKRPESLTQLEEEAEIAQYIQANGRLGMDRNIRDRQLFLNHPLFGNDKRRGSNTAGYVASNQNVGGIELSSAQVFTLLGRTDLYEKYKDQLESLHAKYQKQEFGNLIMIAIPKDRVNDFVMPVYPGGYKRGVAIKWDGILGYIPGISKKMTHTGELLEKWRHEPESFIDSHDEIEYTLTMTHKNGGLDPDSGIKVFPIMPRPAHELAELQKEEAALMERIKADFQNKGNHAIESSYDRFAMPEYPN